MEEQQQHKPRRTLAPLAALICVGLLGGCAATPKSEFALARDKQVRMLTSHCYRKNEGTRVLFENHGLVWMACHRWAEDKIPDYAL